MKDLCGDLPMVRSLASDKTDRVFAQIQSFTSTMIEFFFGFFEISFFL